MGLGGTVGKEVPKRTGRRGAGRRTVPGWRTERLAVNCRSIGGTGTSPCPGLQ